MLTTLAVILIVIAVVLGLAMTKSGTFRVQRSAAIEASPETVFKLIDDFHGWKAWSPYEKLDPGMSTTFSGAPRGKGSMYAWRGNSRVGEGRMEIVDSRDPSLVAISLDMLKPFSGHNDVRFTIEPRGGATNVTWAMEGKSSFIPRVMSVFMNMDKMIGGQFEEGLANLKRLAEARRSSAALA